MGASLEGCACGLGRIYFDRCCGSAAVAPACRGVSPVLNTAVRRWWRTVHHFRGHLCYYLPPANGNAGNPPALQHTPTPRVPGASCFFQPAELGAVLRGGMKKSCGAQDTSVSVSNDFNSIKKGAHSLTSANPGLHRPHRRQAVGPPPLPPRASPPPD